MLGLKAITKNYLAGDSEVQALKGIDIMFRQNEFVAVLGPSGCGKTTLLNIVGGLDRYTSGDLIISGKSTKEYKDRDWDHYRNHTIGFVFQTYNLIPHQTVLSNVELALTLSGISKSERRERAKKMLERVGLGDQLHKKPNQMSGGQMQRVAIARALINDPEILLADEPTGALDTETSVQIMDLLQEIAKDRLVIMVTHNPELAEKYATRIIRLLDGKVQSDTMPFSEAEAIAEQKAIDKKKAKEEKDSKKKKQRVSMSTATAFSLSLNNLMTKKARTLLTSFAGSIGIIGISLILSLSDGFQTYINKVQENTLSAYPLSIMSHSVDLSAMVESVTGQAEHKDDHPLDKVYSTGQDAQMLNAMISEVKENDMPAFKKYLEENESRLKNYTITYNYNITPQVFLADTKDGPVTVNPNPLVDAYYSMLGYDMTGMSSSYSEIMQMSTNGMDIWTLLYGDQTLLDAQYDVIDGHWPKNKNEVVLVVDEYNEINGMTLYGLGLRDPNDISDLAAQVMAGKPIEVRNEAFTYKDLMDIEFRVILNTDFYEYNASEKAWKDKTRSDEFISKKIKDGLPVHITGIVRQKSGVTGGALRAGTICYTNELIDYLLENINASDIVKEQKAHPDTDVFTGYPFEKHDEVTIDDVYKYIDNLNDAEFAQLQAMFTRMNGDSFSGKDVVDALNAMSDEELVAAIKPSILEKLTLDEAKQFFATEQGKAALSMLAQNGGEMPSTDTSSDGSAAENDPLNSLSDEDVYKIYYNYINTQFTADQLRISIAQMSDSDVVKAYKDLVLTTITADDAKKYAAGDGKEAMTQALAKYLKKDPSEDLIAQADDETLLEIYRAMLGEQLTAADIRTNIGYMPDEELLESAKPALLDAITIDSARAFLRTDEGKEVLAALASQSGTSDTTAEQSEAPKQQAAPDIQMDDKSMLEAYKQIVGSQLTAKAVREQIANMSEEEQNALAQSFNPAKDKDSLKNALRSMDESMLLKVFKEQILAKNTDNTYEGNLSKLGSHDPENPFSIFIYSNSFEAKEQFKDFITEYNDKVTAEGNEDAAIEYSDYIGILLSSVTKIINMVSYVLIGFVSISLVVSSIMIGIITYISVLERTKEIGILRSIGASKRDISHVFNAETFIVGLVAGLIGVGITVLLDIPINMIIEHASGAPDVAFLRPLYAAILVGISVLLTLIAGIIPAKLAAKKDPVIALRTE
ncbi:MAG: ABC transporter ATP-binding protein/permease [Oscillospiraceae bacterium]|nr:ABC transporter ATP-binding protein/permease [Oscillospiraceae bacterium]